MVVNFLTTLFRLSKKIVNQSLFRGGYTPFFKPGISSQFGMNKAMGRKDP